MRRLRLLCLALLLVAISVASGQAPPATKTGTAAPEKDSAAKPSAATEAKSAEPAKEEKKDSPRMQKLKQLHFDRRPSAILKAWAPQPPPEPPKDGEAKKPDPLDTEMADFQRHVTLGEWAAVKKYLAGLPKDEAKEAYRQLLRSLQSGPPMVPGGPGGPGGPRGMMPGMNPAMMQFGERNRIAPDDLIGVAAAAPHGLDKDAINALGGVLSQGLASGTVVEAVVARFKAEAARPSGAALTARQAARVLAAAGQAAEAGDFLPTLDKARADKDLEALNLLARHYAERHARESKLALLEQAWEATQAALAFPPTAERRADQEEALRKAVELAPKLKEELGQAWLGRSFTDKPERGMTILATVGALCAQGLPSQPMDPDGRLKALKLQKTAVEALLKASPERARQWRDTVTLLGAAWLKEAEFTQQFARGSGMARMRRDIFGNIYFYNDDGPQGMPFQPHNPNQPRPISVVDMLEARPEGDWLRTVRDDLRPKLSMTICQLHLKADEEAKAFPHIERLAKTHPKKARELANEFLRVWTRNHDPNAAKGFTNPYMFMYGFERRSEGIPLTRSKQERNLVDLAGWVGRLKKLPIGDPDEELLARAFTACHSTAEVYRSEAIEKVFGAIGGLKPKTLAGLAQQMRENLGGVWRKPEAQKDKKTNRRTKDIQSEVKRGYAVARATVEDALKKFPDDWGLVLARAAVLHDEVNFDQEVSKSSEFAPRRQRAYTEFERAARFYAAKVKDLPEDEQSTKVYEQWFYAGLGACDLGQVTEEKVPDLRQIGKVRAALKALPGELAEKHLAKFANLLFTRLSAVKPAVKFRYLKAGFEIVGDRKEAAEAKKVFDYYQDLVREIQLVARVDGAAEVGHTKPFGVFVSLRHTRDIERESGGFGRYLQNQNTNTYFSWNYGRPTADYRDRFQTAATEALKEHFDVLSVTFETDKVHSRADPEYGWRVTPYSYLLLKARGPQVDKLPPLRIDLDFLDTSGYAVLPVESPAVPLDAKAERGAPRPARKLQITQTLDERQAAQGKLLLEVKASALGLVPDLDAILTLKPDGFERVKADDQGVSVSKFDPDSETVAVGSERTWLLTFQAAPGTKPQAFHFGRAKDEGAAMTYQRFNDADLVAVGPEVSLEQQYGGRDRRWVWWAAGAGVALAVLAAAAVVLLRRRRTPSAGRWQVPGRLTPFTAIGLLERIRDEGGLDEAQRAELGESIRQLERCYFSGNGNGDGRVDYRQVAEGWARKAR
jgi:hypothetical protein